VADVLRSRPDEELERDGDAVARAALVIGPALALVPVLTFFVPILGEGWILADLLALALVPATLSLAWRPGGSPSRARIVAIGTAVLVALEIGFVGLAANPCAADPKVVAVVGIGMTLGGFFVALSIGRALAAQGRLLAPLLAAGIVGFIGFFLMALWVLPQVLVLC